MRLTPNLAKLRVRIGVITQTIDQDRNGKFALVDCQKNARDV